MLPEVNLRLDREDTRKCFGCGSENPIGLKLCFQRDGDKVEAEFTPSELHQGWPGLVHGGILFTLLDEAMGYAFLPRGINGVTARAETAFKRPARVGETLHIVASISKDSRRLVETAATITLGDGTVVAEGKALMYVVSRERGQGGR